MPAESARMARAKDLISDDQWAAAIPVLRAAAADPKEPNKDEALFWLAHSQNQAGDLADAVESIRALQSGYPKSRWSGPAGSLMIELAQKLGRRDVLWRTAVPPPPPRAARAAGPRRPRAARGVLVRLRRSHCRRRLASARDGRSPHPAAPPASRPPPPPPMTWFAESYAPGADLRVQALGRLIKTDAQKVIPILRNIAFEATNLGAARGAVFVLAQSRNPQAQSIVVDVAKSGAGIGARRGDSRARPLRRARRRARAARGLLDRQRAGEAAGRHLARRARRRIVAVPDRPVRERRPRCATPPSSTLGRAGGREQQRVLFPRASPETRRAIVRSLFLARDDDSLIRLAEQEKDPTVRAEMLSRLRHDRHAESEGSTSSR